MDYKDIKVSVCCTVYNHEKYLRKCLDGFIMQKTNFAFEVLVNDDKSTDSSAEIIKEYYEKYPDIIVPVFQKENQYSKGVQILADILFPMAKGKYIAICEGDDYWCDENKLQLQHDYMENHEDCVMCLHNTIYHYLNGIHKDHLFNNWKTVHIMTEDEVFLGLNIHTSSYFIRKEYAKVPNIGKKCKGLDYVIRTNLYTIGSLAVLPNVMSVYNAGVANSAMATCNSSIDNKRKFVFELIDYLKNLDSITQYKFTEIIKKRIDIMYFNLLCFEKNIKIKNSLNKKDAVDAAKTIVSNKNYPEFIKSKRGINKMIARFKYEGYVIYPLWRLAYKIYYGGRKDLED